MRVRELPAMTLLLLALVLALGLLIVPDPRAGPGQNVRPMAEEGQVPDAPVLRGTMDGSRPLPPDALLSGAPVCAVPGELRGHVRSRANDEPVAGAYVFVSSAESYLVPFKRVSRTNEKGEFVLRPTKSVAEPRLNVVASGYIPWNRPLGDLVGTDDVLCLLGTGLSVAGTVVNPEGVPVMDATVWCTMPTNRVGWPFGAKTPFLLNGSRSAGGCTKTDSRGAFEISGLPADCTLVLRAGKVGWTFPMPRDRVRSGESNLVVTLFPLAVVRYRLVDDVTGNPVDVHMTMVRLPRSATSVPAAWRTLEDALRGATASSQGWTLVTFRQPQDDETIVSLEDDLRCEIRAYGLGYEPVICDFDIQFGEVITRELRLRRSRGGGLQPVQFTAHLSHGEAFTGGLELAIADTEGGNGPYSLADVDFEEGVALTKVRLPPGEFRVSPRGSLDRDAMIWWHPAGPGVRLKTSGTRDAVTCPLVLRGVPVILDVRSVTGERLRGFNLHVVSNASRVSGGGHGWDVRHLQQTAARMEHGDVPPPTVWLAPGEVEIWASLDGEGWATRRFTLVATRAPQVVQLTLRESR